jgi:hypothetical protein
MSLESTLHKFILPQIDNDSDRTERLITVIESLQPKQKLAFTALIRKQKAFNENMNTYVKMCEDNVSLPFYIKSIHMHSMFTQCFFFLGFRWIMPI